jgi:predicted RNA binding protein YcfA (HicA-like mRNA interferase family)
MTSRELVKLLESKGCVFVRSGKGSHQLWRCPGGCRPVVLTMHPGDIASGTLRAIFKQLEPCLGKEWWK